MLLGEHAVLHGGQALCAAVDQRVRVSLTPRSDHKIYLQSALGNLITTLEEFNVQPPFEFVLTAIRHFQPQLTSGFELEITAEFSSTLGLGSSSAVTVATIGVLAKWLNIALSPLELFNAAKKVIISVQGLGSGADVAAAVYGGLVAYKLQPLEIKPIPILPEVVLVYSGGKVPTATVIGMVAEQQRRDPERYQQLFAEIDLCTQVAITALEEQDWQRLGELMNQHHTLQMALGVSTPLLDELVAELNQQSSIYGAKISGSGLGDCVLGLGTMAKNVFPTTPAQQAVGVKQIPVKISPKGFKIE